MVDISKLKRLRKDDLFIWALSRYSIPDEVKSKKDLLEWLEVQFYDEIIAEDELADVDEEEDHRIETIKIRSSQKDFINYPSALPKGRMA